MSASHSGSFEITIPEGATIEVDIVGSGGNPAVYTQQPSIDLLFNSALISSEAVGFATGVNLSGTAVGSFTNTGTITAASGSGTAYAGFSATDGAIDQFSNASGGVIFGDNYGVYIGRSTLGSFTNAGTIEAGLGDITSIGLALDQISMGPGTATFLNQAGGKILGLQKGVELSAVHLSSFTNDGDIQAGALGTGLDIRSANIGSFINGAGASIKGGSVGISIMGSEFGTFINNGVIEGETAITYEDPNASVPGMTIVNAGTITSTNDGVAIDFGYGYLAPAHDDTLVLKTGSLITGEIKFADGDDTLDITDFFGNADLTFSGLEHVKRGSDTLVFDPNSELSLSYPVASDEGDEDDETGQPSGSGSSSPTSPTSPTDRLVIVDPTSVGSNTVAQSTAGVVQGIAGLIGSQAMSAGYSGSLMSPAAAAGGSAVLTALDIGEAERPRVWGDIFGYTSNGPSPAQLSGLAIGADTKFGGTFSAGALLSYSQSAARFSAGADVLASRTGVAGFYGTYHAGVLDIGFSLLGGLQAHESSRRIATAGGIETALGSFGGVFAAPGASAALPLVEIAGTSVALTTSATYVVGLTSGYTETGSSSNLTVGPRSITSLDARLGLEARHAIIAGSLVGEGVVRAGVFGLMNGGGASVPVTLFGQTVDVATTPSSVYGVYAGTGVAADLSETVRFELNADTAARTDGSLSLSLRGGVSGTF